MKVDNYPLLIVHYPFKTAIAYFIYQQIILLFLKQIEAQFPV